MSNGEGRGEVRSEVRGQIAEVKTLGLGFHFCNLTSAILRLTMLNPAV